MNVPTWLFTAMVNLITPLPPTPPAASMTPPPATPSNTVPVGAAQGGAVQSLKSNAAVGVGCGIVITVKRATRLVSVLLAAVAIRRKSVPNHPMPALAS
jgi:hypothetical protein